MNESSLPAFKQIKSLGSPVPRLRKALGRMIDRLSNRRSSPPGERASEPVAAALGAEPPARTGATSEPRTSEDAPDARAAAAVESYMEDNATNVERAARFAEQAGRLEGEGTPSDSARNRAERAREEVRTGLAGLRVSLAAGGDDEAARALDRVVARSYPAFKPSGSGNS